MKKWMLLLAGLLCLVVWVAFDLYHSYQVQTHDHYKDTKDKVLQETVMETVERITYFHGKQTYRIVFGQDANERKMIAWVSAAEIETEFRDQGRSKAAIIENVKNQEGEIEIVRAVPAKREEQKMWEITYKDQDRKWNYAYYDFYEGTFIRSHQLNQDAS